MNHSSKKQSETKNQFGRLKLALTGAALALFAGASVSCSTVHGFGQDVENLGEEVQQASH